MIRERALAPIRPIRLKILSEYVSIANVIAIVMRTETRMTLDWGGDVRHEDHHRRDRPRAREHRDPERDDSHHLLLQSVLLVLGGELTLRPFPLDHGVADAEQQDASCDPEGRDGCPEEQEDVVPHEGEDHEREGGREDGLVDDPAAEFLRVALRERDEERRGSDRVHDREDRDERSDRERYEVARHGSAVEGCPSQELVEGLARRRDVSRVPEGREGWFRARLLHLDLPLDDL